MTQNNAGNAALGRQLLVEYYHCAADRLDDVDYMRRALLAAAEAIGATVVGDLLHHFTPHGVSGVVVIAESHLAVHTWPEYGYAAVDLFTCGADLDPYRGFELLKEALGAGRFETREVSRGVIETFGKTLRHKPLPVETAVI